MPCWDEVQGQGLKKARHAWRSVSARTCADGVGAREKMGGRVRTVWVRGNGAMGGMLVLFLGSQSVYAIFGISLLFD